MPVIHFETADSPKHTQIGEGLVKFAVQADRLESGGREEKYFLRHADGCSVDGESFEADQGFYFNTETGEVLCEEHGRERKEAT